MDPSLEKAVSWLSGQRPSMEALLRRLVDQNSFTRNVAGVNAVASAVAGELDASGVAVERIPGGAFGDLLSFAFPLPDPSPSSSAIRTPSSRRAPSRATGWTASGRSARASST